MPNMRLGLSLHPHPRESSIGAEVIPYEPLGDLLTNALPAGTHMGIHGVRVLRSDYYGPLLRVRRGNNDERDFYANPYSKWVDPQEIEDWVKANPPLTGNNYGRVVTFYDQSSFGADLVQSSQDRQPYVTWKDGSACLCPQNGQLEINNIFPEWQLKGHDGAALIAYLRNTSASRPAGKFATALYGLRSVGTNAANYGCYIYNELRTGFHSTTQDQGYGLDSRSAYLRYDQESRPASIAVGVISRIYYSAGMACLLFYGENGATGTCQLFVNTVDVGTDQFGTSKNWSPSIKLGPRLRGAYQEFMYFNALPADFSGGLAELESLHDLQRDQLNVPVGKNYAFHRSLEFDGNGYIRVDDEPYIANYEADTNSRSHRMVFKRNREDVKEYLWSKTNGDGYGEYVYFDTDNTLHWVSTDGTHTAHQKTSRTFTVADGWCMVSLRMSAPRYVDIYVNDSATDYAVTIIQEEFTDVNPVAANEPLLIGMGPGVTEGFQGRMMFFDFWTENLGEDDHCELWAGGRVSEVKSSDNNPAGTYKHDWRFGNQDNYGIERGTLWNLAGSGKHGTLINLSTANLVADVPGAP